jgi:putative hydrolase of HD superfamily
LTHLARTVDALVDVLALKALPRAGWVRVGVASPESVAAHSWGLAWLVMVLLPAHLDRLKALSYAVLHDLPEVVAGDITPADGVAPEEKARREHLAMTQLTRHLPSHLLPVFEAYEAQADEEARFVRQLDRLDMALQAVAYARAGQQGLLQFVRSAQAVVTHPVLRPLMDEIASRFSSSNT